MQLMWQPVLTTAFRLQDHDHLGSKGDIVEVKPGFARHHLFPSGEADYAVPSVLKQLRVGAATWYNTSCLLCSAHLQHCILQCWWRQQQQLHSSSPQCWS
jgi:hypothetical protein